MVIALCTAAFRATALEKLLNSQQYFNKVEGLPQA